MRRAAARRARRFPLRASARQVRRPRRAALASSSLANVDQDAVRVRDVIAAAAAFAEELQACGALGSAAQWQRTQVRVAVADGFELFLHRFHALDGEAD